MQIDPYAILNQAIVLGKLIEQGFKLFQEGKKILLLVDSLEKDADKGKVRVGLSVDSADPNTVIDNQKNHKDVAVLVQITHPAVEDVQRYMSDPAHPLDANLFVISHDSGTFSGSVLADDKPGDWEEILEKCVEQFQSIKKTYGPERFHLFYAGPAALAIALGAKLSKYPIRIYNHSQGNYYPVLDLKS